MLFSKVHVVLPVEEDGNDACMASSRCQPHPLHPLGEDKDRFLYLINDIKNRKDDYAAQLSQVTLAAMSEKQNSGEESEHQIISSLLGRKTDTAGKEEAAEKDILWQARLVLKIAEILDREEDEVARALAFLENSEARLFDRLKGETPDDEEDIYKDLQNIRTRLERPRTDAVKKRLRAWFRFIKGETLPECRIWTTTREEAADILIENHMAQHDAPPVKIGQIDIPSDFELEDQKFDETIEHFTKTAGEHLSNYLNELDAAIRDDSRSATPVIPSQDWHDLLESHYPLSSFGRTTVSFYVFEKAISHYSGVKNPEKISGGNILALLVPHDDISGSK